MPSSTAAFLAPTSVALAVAFAFSSGLYARASLVPITAPSGSPQAGHHCPGFWANRAGSRCGNSTYTELRVIDRRLVARLAADIGEEGQRQPVLVVARQDRFVLIDGYCRVEALRRLRRDTVLALVLELTERDALLFAYRTGSGRRRFALEDGWLLQELLQQFSLTQSELALLLGRSTSFVSRRLALVVLLPPSVQKAVRDGVIGAYGAQQSLVSLSRSNVAHAERLVANLGRTRVTSRQLQALYLAWRQADAQTRERIVDQPVLFLKAEQVEEPRADDPVGDLVRAIEVVAAACHGARKRLRAGDLHLLDSGGRTSVTRAFGEVRNDN